jgi:transketolase
MKAQRDIFLEELLYFAKQDPSILLITVDMGAPALDLWRDQLPQQVVYAGISEQHSINMAAGLSASGKKVYVYFMACWSARCFEQIRYSCAMAKNNITILGNGVGLGYAPAGPAHEPTDDLAYMSSIEGMDIHSPSSEEAVKQLVVETLENPKLRYLRFERTIGTELSQLDRQSLDSGNSLVFANLISDKITKIVLLSSGYLLSRAIRVAETISRDENYGVMVIDIPKIPIVDSPSLSKVIKDADLIITLEEQAYPGGFATAVFNFCSAQNILVKMKPIFLKTAYVFDNGDRDVLLDKFGFSVVEIVKEIKNQILDK